ncbi:MAG: DUF4124 domain-containing protein [Telluria sp.]
MKNPACQLSLILLAACAAPAALAGPDILKCVDRNGHVTLTDQPCPPGSQVALVIPDVAPGNPVAAPGAAQVGSSGGAGATGSGGDEPAPNATPAVEHYPLPPAPPKTRARPAPAKRTPLTRDEVTLKAARMKMLLNDELTRQAGAQ